jgi:transcriptional regulator ATRX
MTAALFVWMKVAMKKKPVREPQIQITISFHLIDVRLLLTNSLSVKFSAAGTKSNNFRMRTRAARGDQPPPEDELGVTTPMSSTWWSQFVQDEDMVKMEHSGKLILLMDILRQCELIGDKVLVFSQSLVSLNLIEEFLAAEDEQNEKNRASLASTDVSFSF